MTSRKTHQVYYKAKGYNVPIERIIDGEKYSFSSDEYGPRKGAEATAESLRKRFPLHVRVIQWRSGVDIYLIYTKKRPLTAEERSKKYGKSAVSKKDVMKFFFK